MWFDVVITIVGLLAVGMVVGVLAGLLGVGGGTVLVPVLLTIFNHFALASSIEMQLTIATSLALTMLTGLSSGISHYLRGNLEGVMVRRWIPGICLGTVVGAALVPYMPATALKLFFLCYLIACVIYSLIKGGKTEEKAGYPSAKLMAVLSTLIGACSALLGVGGGTFTTPVLSFLHYPFRRALAISSLTGCVIGAIGASVIVMDSIGDPQLPRFSFGFMYLPAFIFIGPTSILGSVAGVRLACRLSQHLLSSTYTAFLVLVTVLMAIQVF